MDAASSRANDPDAWLEPDDGVTSEDRMRVEWYGCGDAAEESLVGDELSAAAGTLRWRLEPEANAELVAAGRAEPAVGSIVAPLLAPL